MTPHLKHNIKVFQSYDELNKAAAEFIIAIAKKSIAARGRFTISLSGGQTPEKLYSLLAENPYREQIDWSRTFIFWGDERCVSLDDEQNNAHRAKELLLDKIDIPASNIYRIPVNLPPEEAAIQYQNEINSFFKDEIPHFDIILLGLGENGHTASLFPKTKVLNEPVEGVRAIYVEEEKMFRVTMTAPLINQAHNILFMVTGEKKAEILEKVLCGSYVLDIYPAQLIKPTDGNLFWFIDGDAASLIAASNKL
jgi:6-phosphogluconolactonase